MIYIAFFIVGIFAGIHVLSFGLWLKRQGSWSGFFLTLLLSAIAVGLPLYNVLRR